MKVDAGALASGRGLQVQAHSSYNCAQLPMARMSQRLTYPFVWVVTVQIESEKHEVDHWQNRGGHWDSDPDTNTHISFLGPQGGGVDGWNA